MTCRIGVVVLTALFLLAPAASNAQSADIIVEKKTFEMPSYTTVVGETIKSVKIGWEAAGALNADKSNAILRGSERFGLVASSGASRLKPEGINVHEKINAVYWFLNDKSDVRSSYYLEDRRPSLIFRG
jgi:hypothetical protein